MSGFGTELVAPRPLPASICTAHLIDKPLQARMYALFRVRPVQVDRHRRECRGAKNLAGEKFNSIGTTGLVLEWKFTSRIPISVGANPGEARSFCRAKNGLSERQQMQRSRLTRISWACSQCTQYIAPRIQRLTAETLANSSKLRPMRCAFKRFKPTRATHNIRGSAMHPRKNCRGSATPQNTNRPPHTHLAQSTVSTRDALDVGLPTRGKKQTNKPNPPPLSRLTAPWPDTLRQPSVHLRRRSELLRVASCV